MAIQRLTSSGFAYTVPQEAIDAPTEGSVYVHVAWFHRRGGRWIGEWAGYAPALDTPIDVVGEERERLSNAWLHEVQCGITPHGSIWQTLDQEWDVESWAACPIGGAVCLDVARFGWPVGDHCWHIWNDHQRLLDWPESSVHRFIEVQMDALEVIANQSSHRPVRPGVPGHHLIDITGTAFEPFHGEIFGRVAWRGDRWGFEASTARHRWDWRHPVASWKRAGQCVVSPATRLALTEARVDLDWIAIPIKERVTV